MLVSKIILIFLICLLKFTATWQLWWNSREKAELSLSLSHALSFHFSLPDNKHQFSQIFQLILSSKSDNMVECRLVAVVSAILTMRHRRSSCLKLWWCMYTIIKKQQTLIIDKRMSVYVWLICDLKKTDFYTDNKNVL